MLFELTRKDEILISILTLQEDRRQAKDVLSSRLKPRMNRSKVPVRNQLLFTMSLQFFSIKLKVIDDNYLVLIFLNFSFRSCCFRVSKGKNRLDVHLILDCIYNFDWT